MHSPTLILKNELELCKHQFYVRQRILHLPAHKTRLFIIAEPQMDQNILFYMQIG